MKWNQSLATWRNLRSPVKDILMVSKHNDDVIIMMVREWVELRLTCQPSPTHQSDEQQEQQQQNQSSQDQQSNPPSWYPATGQGRGRALRCDWFVWGNRNRQHTTWQHFRRNHFPVLQCRHISTLQKSSYFITNW